MIKIASLDNYTWDDISTMEYGYQIKLGDTKTIDCGTYGTRLFDIIGINHDLSDSLTFMSRTLFGPVAISDGTNEDAFRGSSGNIEAYLDSIVEQMPEDLQNILVTVLKYYNITSTLTGTMKARLFLPSLLEIGIDLPEDKLKYPDGKRYEYFDGTSDKLIRATDESSAEYSQWWTRTLDVDNNFYSIKTDGTYESVESTNSDIYVCPCFTIINKNKVKDRVGIKYPAEINDQTDIIDCININKYNESVDRIYYPIMFCV